MAQSGPHLEKWGPDFQDSTVFEQSLHTPQHDLQAPTEFIDENGEQTPLSSVSFDHIKTLDAINIAIAELEQEETEAERQSDTARSLHVTTQLLKAWRQQVRIMNNRV